MTNQLTAKITTGDARLDQSLAVNPLQQLIERAADRAIAKANTGKCAKVAPGFYIIVVGGELINLMHTGRNDPNRDYWFAEEYHTSEERGDANTKSQLISMLSVAS